MPQLYKVIALTNPMFKQTPGQEAAYIADRENWHTILKSGTKEECDLFVAMIKLECNKQTTPAWVDIKLQTIS